jgi:uncharacterized protein YcgI (DUF1989 family)
MDLLLEETVPGGGHASLIVKRGQSLRITDLRGGANVSVMMINATEKSERLNLPDTLKCQHTAKLTAGHCLYSDMGRVLAGIVVDTCGWHDSIGGVSNADEVRKWGLGISDLLMTTVRCGSATGFSATARTPPRSKSP